MPFKTLRYLLRHGPAVTLDRIHHVIKRKAVCVQSIPKAWTKTVSIGLRRDDDGELG
jgi:hypothetical protein